MTGSLTEQQMRTLLTSQVIGRLGGSVKGLPYVIPISYAYDHPYTYSHTREGTKVFMMRQNKQVCLQVDHIDNLANWRSVMAWGTYEELSGQEADEGLQIIKNRLSPLTTSVYSRSLLDTPAGELSRATEAREVIFRIKLDMKSGRYEKSA
jgi:nitroimidazol reductase NimA-like FMN-containing flavoprotein (pyridoxamine 5'-phosphate oxidase superfamily)